MPLSISGVSRAPRLTGKRFRPECDYWHSKRRTVQLSVNFPWNSAAIGKLCVTNSHPPRMSVCVTPLAGSMSQTLDGTPYSMWSPHMRRMSFGWCVCLSRPKCRRDRRVICEWHCLIYVTGSKVDVGETHMWGSRSCDASDVAFDLNIKLLSS